MYFIYTSNIKVYFKYTSSNFSAGEKVFPKKSVLYYKYRHSLRILYVGINSKQKYTNKSILKVSLVKIY